MLQQITSQLPCRNPQAPNEREHPQDQNLPDRQVQGVDLQHLRDTAPANAPDSLLKHTASLAALPPAEHLATWEAHTLILAANAADQQVTSITWPRIVDATKASPICQKLIKLIQTKLPEEKMTGQRS